MNQRWSGWRARISVICAKSSSSDQRCALLGTPTTTSPVPCARGRGEPGCGSVPRVAHARIELLLSFFFWKKKKKNNKQKKKNKKKKKKKPQHNQRAASMAQWASRPVPN